MFPGILNKRILLLFLMFCPTLLKAQFSHQLEVLYEKGFHSYSDKVSYNKGYINYYENNIAKGTSGSLSLTYNLKKLPFSLIISAESTTFDDYSVSSSLQSSDGGQQLKINSYALLVQYSFLNKSTIKPFCHLGVTYNLLGYNRSNISYNYTNDSNSDFIQIENITWGYSDIQSDFSSFGITGGLGLHIRLTDKIGLNGKFNLDFIPNDSDWIGNNLLIKSYKIGVYYRLFKRTNNLY